MTKQQGQEAVRLLQNIVDQIELVMGDWAPVQPKIGVAIEIHMTVPKYALLEAAIFLSYIAETKETNP